MDGWMDDGWMVDDDRWMDVWMDKWMLDGWMDGWMGRCSPVAAAA